MLARRPAFEADVGDLDEAEARVEPADGAGAGQRVADFGGAAGGGDVKRGGGRVLGAETIDLEAQIGVSPSRPKARRSRRPPPSA
ncbi:MAG: hypothetical protein HZY79_04570 [Rhodoblastus sp.]|nr:MAG: hypothetical protein HZY79_04570 [Rhodoblastus sp.]